MAFEAAYPSDNCTSSGSAATGVTVTCEFNLAANATKTIRLEVTPLAAAEGANSNTANLTAEYDSSSANNQATANGPLVVSVWWRAWTGHLVSIWAPLCSALRAFC